MLSRYRHSKDWPQVSSYPLFNWSSPWRTFDLLAQQFSRAWEELDDVAVGAAGINQNSEFRDKGDNLELKVQLPGISSKDIDLSVTGESIFVRAERKVEPPKGYSAHRRERASYRFEHAWTLPMPVDSQKADAQLQDGVLTVTLPKSPNARPKQIAVKAG
jgi:HSP20 family molecular chaperone IbpA